MKSFQLLSSQFIFFKQIISLLKYRSLAVYNSLITINLAMRLFCGDFNKLTIHASNIIIELIFFRLKLWYPYFHYSKMLMQDIICIIYSHYINTLRAEQEYIGVWLDSLAQHWYTSTQFSNCKIWVFKIFTELPPFKCYFRKY